MQDILPELLKTLPEPPKLRADAKPFYLPRTVELSKNSGLSLGATEELLRVLDRMKAKY